MMLFFFFFNRAGLERIGVVGLDLDSCCWDRLSALDHRVGDRTLLGWSAGSGCGTSLQKQERRRVGRGFARGRSDA